MSGPGKPIPPVAPKPNAFREEEGLEDPAEVERLRKEIRISNEIIEILIPFKQELRWRILKAVAVFCGVRVGTYNPEEDRR